MTGHVVHVGHKCELPPALSHTVNTIWQCDDCRRYWRNTGASWSWVSPIAVALLRANAELIRELGMDRRSDR